MKQFTRLNRRSHFFVTRTGRPTRAGFTLMELLLVMAILVIMASMVTFAFLNIQKNAQSDLALTQISMLEDACTQFKLQVGRFPATLDDLVAQPAQMTQRQWRGPYLNEAIKPDPWGRPYNYTADDANNRVFISSTGPDGQPGTADDVPETGGG